MSTTPNPFGARGSLPLGSTSATIFRLPELERKGVARLDRLPFSIRILLENALRFAGRGVVHALAVWMLCVPMVTTLGYLILKPLCVRLVARLQRPHLPSLPP